MEYRPLGKTGLMVSAIALGTVSLGMDYGIAAPGEFGQPAEGEVIRLLQHAAEIGINLFDTAPAYGVAERLLGLALGSSQDCYIASKIAIPLDLEGNPIRGVQLQNMVRESLENSLRALRRERIDVLQIHNATREIITQGDLAETLLLFQKQGKVRHLGASVYGEEAALAVIDEGCFDVLQIAYNILDQRMASSVFPATEQYGVGIIARSALLKGVLSSKAQWLPPEMDVLRQASERVISTLNTTWEELPSKALRFCLSVPQIASVLVGARTSEELEQAVKAEESGTLPSEEISQTFALALTEENLLNPTYWIL